MATIYQISDRINVNVGGVDVKIRPLTRKEKADVQSKIIDGEYLEATALAMKCAIKDVAGLKMADGSDYKLKFEDDNLTDETVDNLLNLEIATELGQLCIKLTNGIPKEVANAQIKKKASRRKK